jgi:hypothetical protein
VARLAEILACATVIFAAAYFVLLYVLTGR